MPCGLDVDKRPSFCSSGEAETETQPRIAESETKTAEASEFGSLSENVNPWEFYQPKKTKKKAKRKKE